MRLPARNICTIDLKEFKFPPLPKTPSARRYSDRTPGSGFDVYPLLTASLKRSKRPACSNSSKDREIRLAVRPKSKTVGHGSSSGQSKQGAKIVRRRLFGESSFNNTAAKTCLSFIKSQRSAEVATAEEVGGKGEEQFLPQIYGHRNRSHDGLMSPNDRQNRREARRLGEALAEQLNEARSSCRDSAGIEEASNLDNVTDHTMLKTPEGHGMTADKVGDTENPGPGGTSDNPAFSPYYAYPHPPSSALQDAPVRDAEEPTSTSASEDLNFFPHYGYPHAPSTSSSPSSASPTGAAADSVVQFNKDKENADKKANENSSPNRYNARNISPSLPEDDEEMLEEEGEDQDTDFPHTSDEDWDRMHNEAKVQETLDPSTSSTQSGASTGMQNGSDSQQTWQGFSPISDSNLSAALPPGQWTRLLAET